MDKMSRHAAIVKLISIPETHLSAEDKASIIELLFDSTSYYIYNNDTSTDTVTTNPLITGPTYKVHNGTSTDIYGRPPNGCVRNSSSCD